MKISFRAAILKFDKNGEKTSWQYIEIPEDLSELLHPGIRRSYRVKGKIDTLNVQGLALLPVKGGGFILPLNADLRKAINKNVGALVLVQIEVDDSEPASPAELLEALATSPSANVFFKQLPLSHRNYYRHWVGAAKSTHTRTNRSVLAVLALENKWDFAAFMAEEKLKKQSRKF